jgi:hypothetical protein
LQALGEFLGTREGLWVTVRHVLVRHSELDEQGPGVGVVFKGPVKFYFGEG